jgi:hypothetical protein
MTTMLPSRFLVHWSQKKNKKSMATTAVAFFGLLQPKKKQEGDGSNCRRLLWCATTRKNRRRQRHVVAVAFFGSVQPKKKKKVTAIAVVAFFGVALHQKTKKKAIAIATRKNRRTQR